MSSPVFTSVLATSAGLTAFCKPANILTTIPYRRSNLPSSIYSTVGANLARPMSGEETWLNSMWCGYCKYSKRSTEVESLWPKFYHVLQGEDKCFVGCDAVWNCRRLSILQRKVLLWQSPSEYLIQRVQVHVSDCTKPITNNNTTVQSGTLTEPLIPYLTPYWNHTSPKTPSSSLVFCRKSHVCRTLCYRQDSQNETNIENGHYQNKMVTLLECRSTQVATEYINVTMKPSKSTNRQR
jgi:hypothetical protein